MFAVVEMKFSCELKSKVLYHLECNGCKSIYVDQRVRHLTTRVEEQRKTDTPIGQHLKESGGDGLSSELSWKIIDRANSNNEIY